MADIVAHVQPETSYRLTGSKRPRYEVPRNDAWVASFNGIMFLPPVGMFSPSESLWMSKT